LKFLKQLLARPNWAEKTAARERTVRELAECVAQSRDAKTDTDLLDTIADQKPGWRQYTMLDGIASLGPTKTKGRDTAPAKPLRFASEPAALARLSSAGDPGLKQRLDNVSRLLVWPGKPGYTEVAVKPLTPEEQKRFEAGKSQYLIICGACHQPTGLGLDGLAPPLVDSDFVVGSPERLARIALLGVRGPLNIKGKKWELEMPPLNILGDEDLASLLTFVRREWGHTASPVSPGFVARVRAETGQRAEAWTEPELLKMQ
jgi:mono/diheme cytochrome c family protein